MVTFREIIKELRLLPVDTSDPVLVHASLSSFGEVRGGAETMLAALTSTYQSIMMPAFTFNTLLIPEAGPALNGLDYGSGLESNRLAEFFHQDMPADSQVGVIAETLRCQPQAQRSSHPILSFSGINVEEALQSQTLADPLAPVGVLAGQQSWVFLIGVGHTCNVGIHYAEKMAGRKQFTRWALTPGGVRECSSFPGCSHGFEHADILLSAITQRIHIGQTEICALPLNRMLSLLSERIRQDPHALLCQRLDCALCNAVRSAMKTTSDNQP